jgi:ABC-type phosphate transport system ATPase subunit
MTEHTIAQMTQEEFKEMLEILGDPDEGLEIRSEVRERLLRQGQEVAGGQKGRLFEDVVQEPGLE